MDVTLPKENLADETEDAPFIDNPELLLQLINDGTLNIVQSGSQGEEEVADPRNNPWTAGLWSSEIENLFLPRKENRSVGTTCIKPLAKKRNTSHRLLTNSEVINEKREVAKRKEEKNRQKLEREQKRLLKKVTS